MEHLWNDIQPPTLARLAVERFTAEGEILVAPNDPEGILADQAGVFVTLRTADAQLRGCIGTITPAFATVAEEIIHNAISAATRDPRFPPVAVSELPQLAYGVDVLSAPESARGKIDLDALRYGVIIETVDGKHRGLLLPGIEGIETVDQQWMAVHQKAGIRVGTPVKVERFTVTRFGK